MTIGEVAELLRVTERTVYEWANEGKIPARKVGTSWRFVEEEINEWLENKRNISYTQFQPTSAPTHRITREDLDRDIDGLKKQEQQVKQRLAELQDEKQDLWDRVNQVVLTDAEIKQTAWRMVHLKRGIAEIEGRLNNIRDELQAVQGLHESLQRKYTMPESFLDTFGNISRADMAEVWGAIINMNPTELLEGLRKIGKLDKQTLKNMDADELRKTFGIPVAQRESKGDDDMGLNSEEDDKPGFWHPGEDDKYNERVGKIANAIGRVMNAKGVRRTQCWTYTMLQDKLSPRCAIVDIQQAGERLIAIRMCKPCKLDFPERPGLKLNLNPRN